MVRATAVVAYGANEPCRVEPIVLDDPRPDEILVRVVAAGMCGTDLGIVTGHLPRPTPGVLGHEGAGVVEAVGTAVSDIAVGDTVLLSYSSCGACQPCRSARPALCEQWMSRNVLSSARGDGSATMWRPDGGDLYGRFFGQSSWATLAVVDARCAVRVEPEAPLEILAPLGCCGQTGAGTVFNVLKPSPGASLVVLGTGAVGLCAVMAAALTPATMIIAVDRVPSRLSLARELGATDSIDASQVGAGDLAEELQRLTGGRGVDLALDTTADAAVVRSVVGALAVGGTMALVGAPAFGSEVSVDAHGILRGRSVVGVTEGDADPRLLIPVLARLHSQGRFPLERIIQTYQLDDIDRAIGDLGAGRAIKPVLLPPGSRT